MMKVLFVLDTLNRGGAETHALDVCRNAAAHGLSMSVAACGGGALEGEFKEAGIPYYRFQRRLPVDPLLLTKLRALIRSQGFEIVHAHQAVDGLHSYLATRGTDAKCVLNFHGHFPDAKNRWTVNFLAPRVDANISCSNGLLPWLREQGLNTDGFHVIYNGVDEKRLAYSGPRVSEELGIPENTLLFGMVAHFYPAARKDQMTLCRAFAKMASDVPNSHLLIVGRVVAGAERKYEECVRIARDAGLSHRVHFLGQRDDIAKIVTSMDLYVLSSLHEGLPVAAIEAMLSKRPTILSDIGPHMEVAADGEHADMFRTQDADELAAKMLRFASDQVEMRRLADNAYDFARRTFSIEAHIIQLAALYRSITDPPGA